MRCVLAIVMVGLLSGCGIVGAPVAPESIGVAPAIKRQQQQREAMELRQQEEIDHDKVEEPDPAMRGQEEDLPPLRPVGTR